MTRPRNVYQKGTNMFLMCRVCLTQSANMMFDLTDDLELDGYNGNKLSTVEALQRVASSKVVLNGQFPHYICPVCMSMLKMSLKFIMQYKDSQDKLHTMYGLQDVDDCDDDDILNYLRLDTGNIEKENHAPVEVIYNNSKFDLNDIIVVEKVENKRNEFKGFLENLGKEISATFAEKSTKNKVDTNGDGSTVSILVKDNDRVFPIRELQLDEDANLINYIVDDPISIQVIDEETFKKESEPPDNIEYIHMEPSDQDVINSFIIEEEQSNSATEDNCNADRPRPKRTIKVGKRRRKIKSKLRTRNNDDIFEREVRFPCEICRGIFPTNRLLKAHVKRIHFPKSQTFTCEICGYNNNSRSAYVNHKLKHVGKQFKCEICDKPYYTKAVLKVHMETHINKRQHLCNVCGKGFNYANALVYHMRLHTGEKNYKCEYCEKSFRMPNSLQRHIRVHTGERPYKCRFCQRAFSSRGEVSCHENIHTGFRPYHCKYCKKGFSKTHNLKLHLLSHKGPHKCEICLKSFIEEAILSMHYKITHRCIMHNSEEEDGSKENSDTV